MVIAEDEALIRMDLAEMLAEQGYEVVGEAGDGARAVELAEQLRPDLVILDVKMPVLDGIAAAERIAAQRIAPVVILTAFSQRELVERARDAGAMAYLVKPFSAGDLVPAIEMAVSRFAEVHALEQEVADLQERLETRKTVDRAKSVLQGAARAERAGRVPLDPEDRDGPAAVDARGRPGRRGPRARARRLIGHPAAYRPDLGAKVTNRQRPRPLRGRGSNRDPASDTFRPQHPCSGPEPGVCLVSRRPHDPHDPCRPRRCGTRRSRARPHRVRWRRRGPRRHPDGDGEETSDAAPTGDGTLTIGNLLPQTGDLAFLGPPEFAGVKLAVEEINAAGGVLGQDVVNIDADSGDGTPDIAGSEVDKLFNQDVDAIIGAAASGVSVSVIDKITGAGVVHFSPANTAAGFDTYDDNGLYFRTAPSDRLQGQVLANLAVEDGFSNVAVMARQDFYGEGLAEQVQTTLQEKGANVAEYVLYSADAQNYTAEVNKIAAAKPDALVLVAFEETTRSSRS